MNSENANIRFKALKKINDEKLIVDIAKNNSFIIVRLGAVEKILNQKMLADLSLNDPDAGIRIAALYNLTNETIISQIASNDPNDDIRLLAFKKIDNYKVFTAIIQSEKKDEVLINAIDEIANRINYDDGQCPEQLLYLITKYSTDDQNRQNAAYIITDQKLLSKIALKNSDSNVRRAAAENITNLKLLADIAQSETNSFVQRTATIQLGKLYYKSCFKERPILNWKYYNFGVLKRLLLSHELEKYYGKLTTEFKYEKIKAEYGSQMIPIPPHLGGGIDYGPITATIWSELVHLSITDSKNFRIFKKKYSGKGFLHSTTEASGTVHRAEINFKEIATHLLKPFEKSVQTKLLEKHSFID